MVQIITQQWGGGWGWWGWTSYTAGNWINIENSEISIDESVVQTTDNLVTNLSNPDDTHYPSAKAVSDAITSSGGWDMLKSVYDPDNVSADAFDYDNFINTPDLSQYAQVSDIPTDNSQLANGCGYITNSALSWYAQTCDIPTDNCQLANWCGYTTCTWTLTSSNINNTAYDASWDGVTTIAPSKNAVYDKLNAMDTTISGKANTSDVLSKTNTISYTPSADYNPATKKYVDDAVEDLVWLWKFLSLWDATTWQPISFPLSTPYTYTTWDYFLVETVSAATPPVNYKPNGSSYDGTASSTTESEELAVWDIYIYDWTTWLLQLNHGKSVSFSEIAWSPSDNTALDNALDAKQDALTLPATPTQWNLVTWGADNETLVDGWAIPVTSVNWQTWAVTIEEWKTKVFTLASTSDLTNAQAAYNWYLNGGNPIIKYSNSYLTLAYVYSSYLRFTRVVQTSTTQFFVYVETVEFTLSSWSVTAISDITANIKAATTAPTSWDAKTITLVY